MCIQRPCFSQTSAMALKLSNAPFTVVPAVELTKNGTFPSAFTFSIAASSSSGIICPIPFVFTFTALFIPMPMRFAPFWME